MDGWEWGLERIFEGLSYLCSNAKRGKILTLKLRTQIANNQPTQHPKRFKEKSRPQKRKLFHKNLQINKSRVI